MNLDYQIAKEYLNKLPDDKKIELCKRTLEGVEEKKKSKKDLRKYYSDFLDKSKYFQDFKRKYGLQK